MTRKPTNADRANRAVEALAVFAERTGRKHPDQMHTFDLEPAIVDLIADLLHFATEQGFLAHFIVEDACDQFETQLRKAAHG